MLSLAELFALALCVAFLATSVEPRSIGIYRGPRRLQCAGTIVSRRHAVTTVNCADGTSGESSNGGRHNEVSRTVPHPEVTNRVRMLREASRFLSDAAGVAEEDYPKYLKELMYSKNNIVIMEFAEPFEDVDIPLLSALNRRDEKPGNAGVIEILKENACNQISDFQVNSTVISREECSMKIKTFAKNNGYDLDSPIFCDLENTQAHVCGISGDKKQLCPEDAGSPFFTKAVKQDRDVLIGIATPLFECQDVQNSIAPSVYTSIVEVADFIKEHVPDAEFHDPGYC